MGELPWSYPAWLIPDVPFTLETLQIILPFSLTMAAGGHLESMMTAQIVNDLTDTPSDSQREMKRQGIANFLGGFLGGMGGCAMIGPSVINVKSGGDTRLGTFVAGAFLLFLILVLGSLVAIIPMAALVAVMIIVSIGTFSWRSIRVPVLLVREMALDPDQICKKLLGGREVLFADLYASRSVTNLPKSGHS